MKQSMQVVTSMDSTEWYTPPHIIAYINKITHIDLDPASCESANQYVRAHRYYTKAENGLVKQWYGNVFLNFPFDDSRNWVRKAMLELPNLDQLFILCNTAQGYEWWNTIKNRADRTCLFYERISFISQDGKTKGKAKKGQTMFYFGDNSHIFTNVFERIGWIL